MHDHCAYIDAWTTAKDYLAVFGVEAQSRLQDAVAAAARDLADLRTEPAPQGSALAGTVAVAERQLARFTRARRFVRLLSQGLALKLAGDAAGVEGLADRAAALMEQDRADLAALASKTE